MPADKIDVEMLAREAGLDWQRGYVIDDELNRYVTLARLVMQDAIDFANGPHLHPTSAAAVFGREFARAYKERMP